jgi:hypothetical protein
MAKSAATEDRNELFLDRNIVKEIAPQINALGSSTYDLL